MINNVKKCKVTIWWVLFCRLFFIYLFTLFIWLCWVLLAACGIFSWGMRTLSGSRWDLVPWSGTKPGDPALGTWRLSHWTTGEVPDMTTINVCYYWVMPKEERPASPFRFKYFSHTYLHNLQARLRDPDWNSQLAHYFLVFPQLVHSLPASQRQRVWARACCISEIWWNLGTERKGALRVA